MRNHQGKNFSSIGTARWSLQLPPMSVFQTRPEKIACRKFSDDSQGSARITATGHADRSGPENYNMALSLRRANAVKDALIRDGVPAGAIQVNVKELGCDAYATSGHKWLMGPKGTGLLYISKEVQNRIRPIQYEDSYNTFNESAGLGNLPGILGLAAAIDYLNETGIEKAEEKNLSLRNRLYYSLLNETTLKIQSPPPGAIASPLLSCRLPENIDAGRFASLFLDKHKISFRPVHKKWFNGIRFSLHVFNTEKQVDKLVEIIKKELSS